MERSRKILHKIASASHRVVTAANEHADRKDLLNVERAHFQLEEEMQKIFVACVWLTGTLPIMPPLPRRASSERLKDWLTSDEPRVCCETLNQMEVLLRGDDESLRISTSMRVTRMTDNLKIDEAVNLFDSRKQSFHLLFATDIGGAQQQKDVFHDVHYPSTPYHTTTFIPPIPSPRSNAPDSYRLAPPSASPTRYSPTPIFPFIEPSVHGTPVTEPHSDPPDPYSPAASAHLVSPEVPHAVLSGESPGPAMSQCLAVPSPWAIPPSEHSPPRSVQYLATWYNAPQPLPGTMRPPVALPPMGPWDDMPALAAWPMPPGASPYSTWQHRPTQRPAPINRYPRRPHSRA